MIQRYARKMHGRVFGEMFDPMVRARPHVDTSLRYSAEVSACTSIPLPLRSTRPSGVVCVP